MGRGQSMSSSFSLKTGLLAGTAISTALALGLPATARAQELNVTQGGNGVFHVTNTGPTQTIGTINDGFLGPNTAVIQFFNNSVVGNNSGAITGGGLQLLTVASDVKMINTGSITSDMINPNAQDNALSLISQGAGNIVYRGNGSITSPVDTVAALVAETSGGNVRINAGGVIQGNGGIFASTTSAGNVSIITSNDVTSANDTAGSRFAIDSTVQDGKSSIVVNGGTNTGGISSSATGTGTSLVRINGGSVTAALNNAVTAQTTSGLNKVVLNGGNIFAAAADAINASSTSGAITVSTADGTTILGHVNGITAASTTGAITGKVLGDLTAATGVGISMTTGGNIRLTTGSGSILGTSAAIMLNGGNVALSGGSGQVFADGGSGIVADGSGSVKITTGGTVTATNGAGIVARAAGTGNVTVDSTAGAVTSTTAGIFATSDGGRVKVTAAHVSGEQAIEAASTTGNVIVTTSGTVTGSPATSAPVIFTETAGTTRIHALSGTTITGGDALGGSGIQAQGLGAGNIAITIDSLATIVSSRAVTIDTSAGTGGATLTNAGSITGVGTLNDPTIRLFNNDGTNAIRIANTGTIGNAGTIDGFAVLTSANTQAVNVRNAGQMFGNVWLGGGASSFRNTDLWAVTGGATATAAPAGQFGNGSTLTNTATWNINNNGAAANAPGNFTGFSFTNANAGTATNTVRNNGTVNASGSVNFQFVNAPTVITNAGVFNVGSVPGSTTESTSFSSAATPTTLLPSGVQTVTNTGVYTITGLGTGTAVIGDTATVAALGPSHVGALNFYAGNGSSFTNAGLVNMQADGGSTRNAVTFNAQALGGTSDLNYTYTWAGPLATTAYDFKGAAGSTVAIDTAFGLPGSTSDRLVVGGNISGTTQLLVNNTNAGPSTFNATGITAVAVQGSGSNNVVVSSASPGFVNFGPLGAIQRAGSLLIDPLLYVPGGATSTGGLPNGNAYQFFGLPGPFAFNLPVALTAAQTIWEDTALTWEDRQDEIRSWYRRGGSAAGVYGAYTKAPPATAPVDPNAPGVWVKVSAAGMNRTATDSWASAFNSPVFAPLGTVDNSYKQAIYSVVGGVDFATTEVTGPDDQLVFGVMGGYINSAVNFASPNAFNADTITRFNYKGGTVGVSADYLNGNFFVDTLLKADFLTLDIGGVPAGFMGGAVSDVNVNATTFGTLTNAGYRFQSGRYFVEPLATLSWEEARIGSFAMPGAAVNVAFNPGDTVNVAGGFRFGSTILDDRSNFLQTAVTARLWDRVTSNNTVTFNSFQPGNPAAPIPGTAFNLSDDFTGAYGQVALQFDWIDRTSGWSTFAKGDIRFNDQFTIVTGRAGVRYGF